MNIALRRTVGYQLVRPPGHPSRKLAPASGQRLLVAPVVILSAARSGSTLLRAVLGSHSQMYAPPELPLLHLGVNAKTRWIQTSMAALKLTADELDYLLWDRVLADTLARSGKSVIVLKTPANVLIWQRIGACWPDARFVFLLRHPAASVASLRASWDPKWHPEESGTVGELTGKALRYMRKVEEARQALSGMTVRYEELTADPETTVRRLCGFLRVRFEPAMLDYGQFGHSIAAGLGDTSDKIRSGRIHAAVPPTDLGELPAGFREICAVWGYQDAAAAQPAGRVAVPAQPAQSQPVPQAASQPIPQQAASQPVPE